jgi:hypothetical protein
MSVAGSWSQAISFSAFSDQLSAISFLAAWILDQ